jgi:hypothetical protein
MRGLIGQSLDRCHQLIVHPLVSIEMQLPTESDGQMIDGPVALNSVMLKCVLDHDGAKRARGFRGSITAE